MIRIPIALLCALICSGCGDVPAAEPAPAPESTPAPPEEPTPGSAGLDRGALRERAVALFGALPADAATANRPLSDEKVALGRLLYHDPRLSKNHDISCNSCHRLDAWGVDGEATSPGHRGQRGERNSPSVYNAALHFAQFWDGRAADVEEQAKGPVLNPIEMAMPDEEAVLVVLRSVPGYAPLFAAAFPEDEEPISYDNMAEAIGAFERRLITPARFDAFVAGDTEALSDRELAGLQVFIDTGCIQCHVGSTFGGNSYQKLGRMKPYPDDDPGRFAVTGQEADRQFFKVPSLRNVEKTGPYFHDGSIASLDEAIRLMGDHQLDRQLSADDVSAIASFLASLTAEIDPEMARSPALPESGPETPAPDPS